MDANQPECRNGKKIILTDSHSRCKIGALLCLALMMGSVCKAARAQTQNLSAPSIAIIQQTAQNQTSSANLTQWGLDALKQIRSELYLPGRHLYAEESKPGEPAPDKPSFMWTCGVQLSALAAAAPSEPVWKTRLLDYAQALDRYWAASHEDNSIGGYDVLPVPKPLDRYYDDNEWMVLALAEAYDVTADPALKVRAERAMQFVLSGEDKKLGGGIYWREQEKKSKNTCSNGPAIAAALRLYQITRRPEYLVTARRLYIWTNAHLQDTDGLYWDNIKLSGAIEKTKWSYNTALMLRANCLLYQETHEKPYLEEAQRLARAAEAQWVKPDTGAIADGGKFAHLLSEAFLYLSDQETDPNNVQHWRSLVRRALTFVHDHVRDPNGHYPDRWENAVTEPLGKFSLIDQACVARAYLVCARY
jgi:hypothetical protein